MILPYKANQIHHQENTPTNHRQIYPMTSANMPPVNGTTLANPCEGRQHGVPKPTYPNEPLFHQQRVDMLQGLLLVKQGKFPLHQIIKYSELPGYDGHIPKPFVELIKNDPLKAIQLVNGDNPNELAQEVLKWVVKERGYRAINRTTPYFNDFQADIVNVSREIANASTEAFKRANEVKKYYGRIRPVVDFYVNCGHPPALLAFLFLVAHPPHEEYVQGHGTIAGMTMNVIRRAFNLSTEDDREVYLCAYWIAALRCMLGVHWWDSCIPSLRLGECYPVLT